MLVGILYELNHMPLQMDPKLLLLMTGFQKFIGQIKLEGTN